MTSATLPVSGIRLKAKAEFDLTESDISYIPNEDFESATENDFVEIDVQLYAEEDGRPGPLEPGELAETFLSAVEQSRLLTFEGEQFLFKRLNFLRFRARAVQAALQTQRRPSRRDVKEASRLLSEAQETRAQLAQANLRLVLSIARKYSTTEDECDDFVAEGNAILMNAIDKFDFARGYRFSTYATHAVQRHLFRLIGRRNKRRLKELTESNVTLTESAVATSSDEPSQEDVMIAARSIIEKIDEVLDERASRIVRGRFGLNESGKGQSLREIGDELGISKERVRQILQQSVERLGTVAEPFRTTFDPG